MFFSVKDATPRPPIGSSPVTAESLEPIGDTDLYKLAAFHRQLIQVEQAFGGSGERFDQEMKAAKKGRDRYSMYGAARSFHDALDTASSELSKGAAKAPELHNSEAKKLVDTARDSLETNLNLRRAALEKMIEAFDTGDLRPSALEDMKQATAGANAASMQEAFSLMRAYALLGVDVDHIDTENGGVLPEKPARAVK